MSITTGLTLARDGESVTSYVRIELSLRGRRLAAWVVTRDGQWWRDSGGE